MMLLLFLVYISPSVQYTKHIQPVNYEVPHGVIFKDQTCWSKEPGDIVVPSNCTTNYCSKCYFNKDIKDYRNHVMSYNDNRLIVGAMDNLLAFDVTDKSFIKIQTVDTSTPQIDTNAYPRCIGDLSMSNDKCKNYNRVLLQLQDQDSLLTCGTNAYSTEKACQIRPIKDLEQFEGLEGEGFVPINEEARNTALFSDSRIFAGTLVSGDPGHNSFGILSAKISQNGPSKSFQNLVSTPLVSDWLNRAKFVASFGYGSYVYIFFQELDYTVLDSSQSVVSRVARVCKEDNGIDVGDTVLNARLWRTFVKSRIFCSNEVDDKTFGKLVYRYNKIGDAVLSGNTMYATFSEGDTSASGSVVCRYNMEDIDNNFETGFYYRMSAKSVQSEARTPPTCARMEEADSDDIYQLKLTSESIESAEPLFLQSGPQFTTLLIDADIWNNKINQSNPVLFIGTNIGRVLKVTWLPNEDGTFQPILIEQLNVAVGDINSDLTVNFLAFEKTTDPNYLFVGTGTSVSKVVISRCLRIPNLSEKCCYASRDPYCGWCQGLSKCTTRPDCSSEWIESVNYNGDDSCSGQDNTIPPKPGPGSPGTPSQKGSTPTTEAPESTLPTLHKPGPPTPDPNHNNTYNTATSTEDSGESPVVDTTDSWKTVAIVMAILCGIFVLISLLLSANLARKWCTASTKAPTKTANNNLHHNYNPLSTNGPKSDELSSDRIPVYNTRTQNAV